MIAAIYARKSTEQNEVPDDEKSVTRQIEHARAYATRKGWTIADEHIYVDDGISGAEFSKRPGFLRLMNVLKPRPPFQILIMSEESRLGRESIETAYALKQIVTAGVRVFFYLEDRERALETPTDKVMLSLTAFADELEREKARQRTYDAMLRKAKGLHVTGGRVFGYDNVEVFSPAPDPHGRQKRAAVVRRVNESEAAVVRRIFELCAAGKGFASIAKLLNEEGAPTPRPRPGRVCAWAPSSLREILYRPLYRGEVVWNRSQKRNSWGLKQQRPRPEHEWIRISAPELRIVSDELWRAAHERLAATRAIYLRGTDGQRWGRPTSGIDSKYVLTGMARCACCGGSLYVRSRSHGRQRALFYGCSSYHLRGRRVCANNLESPMEATNHAVLTAVEREVLHPDVVERAIAIALASLRPSKDNLEAKRQALVADLAQLDEELRRLTTAIASGGDLPSLLAAIKARETRRGHLQMELRALENLSRVGQLDLYRIEQDFRTRLTDWQGLLHRHSVKAREILQTLLVDKLVFTPRRDVGSEPYYEFAGQGALGKLFMGLVNTKALVAPTGFEPVFQP